MLPLYDAAGSHGSPLHDAAESHVSPLHDADAVHDFLLKSLRCKML